MNQLKEHIHISIIIILSISLSSIPWVTAIGKNTYQIISHGDREGLADIHGNIVIPAIYENLGWSPGTEQVYEDVIGYEQNGLWGIININNDIISKPLYSRLFPTKEKLLIASLMDADSKTELYGLLNIRGKVVVDFEYSYLAEFGSMLRAARREDDNRRWGVVSFKGKNIIPIGYDSIKAAGQYFVVFLNKKASLFNPRGQQLTGFYYDDLEEKNKHLISYLDGKMGLIGTDGRELIPTVYKELSPKNDSTFYSETFSRWQFISLEKGTSNTHYYDDIELIAEGKYKVVANGKYGVLNEDGSLLLPVRFDSIYYAAEYYYALSRSNHEDSWQLYSLSGELVITDAFQALYPMSEGLIAVRKNGYWGYINNLGQQVIDFKFDHCWPFLNGIARIKYDRKEGIVSRNGDLFLFTEGATITVLNENVSLIRSGKLSGILDERGAVLHETTSRLKPLNIGILEIAYTGAVGLFNNKGESILELFYDEIYEGRAGNAFIAMKNNMHGVVDKQGNWILPLTPRYQELIGYSEGFISIKEDGKYGFIDKNSNLRIANRYEGVKEFKDGMAAVKLLGKWGFVDRIEHLRIQPLYDSVSNFDQGRAFVKKKGLLGIIDMAGNEILTPDYDSLYQDSYHSYVIVKNDKFGLITEEGRLQLEPKFEFLEQNADGNLTVGKRRKFGVINNDGINLIPTIYEKIIYDEFNKVYLASEKGKREKLPRP